MSTPAIFLHIPKTGGTTLRRLIEANYPPASVWAKPIRDFKVGQDDAWGMRSAPPAGVVQDLRSLDMETVAIISGHFSFGLHSELGVPARYLTMLRDPVSRVLSMHQAWMRRFGPIPLASFIEKDLPVLRNGQTAVVGGTPPSVEVSEGDLKAAKQNLTDHFLVVGTTEMFDEMVLDLARVMGWRETRYTRQNVSRSAAVPDPSVLAKIEEMNELDRELHRFVSAMARERSGSLSKRKIATHRWSNRAHQLREAAVERIRTSRKLRRPATGR